jgi:alginate O-acetyltransferase complex protein AlgI
MLGRAVTTLRILTVFACVSLAWILFKLPDFGHALDFMGGMLNEAPIPHPARIYRSLALMYSLPVILQHLTPGIWRKALWQRLEPYSYGAMAALMFVEAGPDTSFIYFQF